MAACGLCFLSVPVSGQLTLPLVVRVYDAFGLTAVEVGEAQAAFAAVFAAADVDVRWRECRADGPDPCSDGIGLNDLVIRLVPPPQEPHPATAPALGYSSVQTRPALGVIATVYPGRVRTLAQRARCAAGPLLGAAMAHEAGHLLLGSTTHPRTGLMRAQWTARSLESGDPADRRFLPVEAVQIRAAVAARTRRSPSAPVWTAAALRSTSAISADR